MRTLILSFFTPLILAACAPMPSTVTASCVHDGPPPVLRADLAASYNQSPGHVALVGRNDGFQPCGRCRRRIRQVRCWIALGIARARF